MASLFERETPTDPLVVLVDGSDMQIGTASKLAAHQNGGQLHRAFSIYLFDSRARVLLQKRAVSKYHFGGLWTNACCGHAQPEEDLTLTASIRLWQEMRICATLATAGQFTYQATDPVSGLTEREINHVLIGLCDDDPQPQAGEADSCCWISLPDLAIRLAGQASDFTPWFAKGLPLAEAKLSERIPGAAGRSAR